MSTIRFATVAGLFYPDDKEQLRNHINSFLQDAEPVIKPENIFGIVSPHAGYTYSGNTAAYVYNLIKGKKFKRVIIISPSHSEYFPGVSVYEGDAYETPLGLLEVDREFADKLVTKTKSIYNGVEGHRKEHALEVQLPFLQVVLKDFKIVPLVMGDQSRKLIDELAAKLAENVDDETLIVSSSDMSHFYSKSQANKLDSVVEKRINNYDFEGLQNDLELRNTEACGGGPIVVLMKTASLKNIKNSKVVHRSDSGDVSGDNQEVVGYLSAVLY
ncbi:MAG: AmmeMemoRadiSam system protein B [Ignavibacteria bacterium]|jgi:AmmeMemoRadiSam system protein B